MQAGKLDRRVKIQRQTSTQDTYGASIDTWSNYAEVWASVEPLSGREWFSSMQVNAEVSTRIRIRYLSGVTSKMRAIFGTHTYNILAVIDPEDAHKELQLMCSEVI